MPERPPATERLPSLPRAVVLGVFVTYLGLAVIATWPLAARAGDSVFGLGTPPLNVWAIGAVLHRLPRDPLHLFDANAFYPYRHSLAFSEHLLVQALQAAPFVATTGNHVLAHNAVALLTLATAGLGMFLLARELVGDSAAAFGAGVLYAFHSWNINELVRLQILSNQWFPFLVLSLLRYFSGPSRRRALGVGLFCALQGLSCMYWALYLPLLVLPLLVLLQWRARHPWRRLVPLALTFAGVLALSIAFLWPYVLTARELGFERSPPLSVGLERYFDVLPGNVLYQQVLGIARPNRDAAHFLGFVAILTAAWGAWRGRLRPTGPGRAACVVLFASGLLLSLGPEIRLGQTILGPGPYAALYDLLPPFRHVRYPERFALFAMLGMAPLVAAGLARLRPRIGFAGVLALTGILFIEHLSAPLTLASLPTGPRVPEAYRWLAKRDDVQVVADVPSARHKMERHDAMPMYLSTVHWKRTVQGFTGYFPPAYGFFRWRLFHFPAPESLRFCERLGIDAVIVQPLASSEGWAPEGWETIGPFDEGHTIMRPHHVRRGPWPPATKLPALVELSRHNWSVQASQSGAALAIDGDLDTAWSTLEPQGKGDFYRVRFSAPRVVARVSIAVGPPFEFPLRIKLLGDVVGRGWTELPFDEVAAYDRLLALLLNEPRHAWLDLEVAPVDLRALRVRVRLDDAYALPWTMAEIRIWSPGEP
jgi:hypothetical protein